MAVGEDRTSEAHEDDMQRYTVGEAADMLGISEGAVRNRLSRRTLPRVREGGTTYVLLPNDMSRDTDRDFTETPSGMSPPERDTLTSELRDRLHYVEGQLEAERQAHAESRRLLAAALERIPAIEPPQEEKQEMAEPQSNAGVAEEGAQRRGFWSRLFGS
jgi:hypothetical protein